jgi:hypothetical protein
MHLRDALKAVRHGGRWALSLVLARLIGPRRYASTLQPQAVS